MNAAAKDLDVVELANRLIQADTVGANESACVDIIAPILERAGFNVMRLPLSEGRESILATYACGGDFVLSGHLDTVPFTSAEWRQQPLVPRLIGDRLFGRGASDMKAGVAAMIIAAITHTRRESHGAGFTIAMSAGEETGCLGAQTIRDSGLLGKEPILIVGEATSNSVRLGHKGATWFSGTSRGVAAHGSRPELGVNAIEGLIPLMLAVRDMANGPTHSHLGTSTVNLGRIRGGNQTNLVPDEASLTVDLRTVPGMDVGQFENDLARLITRGEVQRILDLPSIWTSENAPLTNRIQSIVSAVTHEAPKTEGATYFTDASVLAATAAPRVYILGPGDAEQAHAANESCSVSKIHQAVEIYGRLLTAWNRGELAPECAIQQSVRG